MLFRLRDVPLPPIQVPKASLAQIPRVAVLFSGGVDCTVIARIAHDIMPFSQAIDLLNVAFENPRAVQAAKAAFNAGKGTYAPAKSLARESMPEHGGQPRLLSSDIRPSDSRDPSVPVYDICPDRQTGRKSLQELRRECPQRTWNFVEGRFQSPQSRVLVS